MQKIFLIFALSLVIERALEQISEFIPRKRRKKVMWLLSMVLSLIITFICKIGVLRELGIIQGNGIVYFLDYFLTGLIISSGSEPVHSLIIALESKKEELKQKVKKIEKN